MENYEIQAHKELHKNIMNCKDCCPTKNEKYCDSCIQEIIDFTNKYGAGTLTRDILVEELEDKIKELQKDNKILSERLDEKIKRVDELKKHTNELQKAPKEKER